MICISIGQIDHLEDAVASGAELLELRLDLIRKEPSGIYEKIGSRIRTVVTYRPGKESAGVRRVALSRAIELGADYVDIELESDPDYIASITENARDRGCQVILSHHDFNGTPSRMDLAAILKACYSRGGDVAKIAATVSDRREVLDLLSLYDLPGRKLIIGMGEPGRITRVVAPYLGAEFTFAALPGHETAPGQLNMEQLKRIYQTIDAP